jgi:hypothetical protein
MLSIYFKLEKYICTLRPRNCDNKFGWYNTQLYILFFGLTDIMVSNLNLNCPQCNLGCKMCFYNLQIWTSCIFFVVFSLYIHLFHYCILNVLLLIFFIFLFCCFVSWCLLSQLFLVFLHNFRYNVYHLINKLGSWIT